MFEKYRKVFEGNDQRGQRYQVILSSGQVFSGVPAVAANANHDGSFSVTMDDGKMREVLWSRLLTATPIG